MWQGAHPDLHSCFPWHRFFCLLQALSARLLCPSSDQNIIFVNECVLLALPHAAQRTHHMVLHIYCRSFTIVQGVIPAHCHTQGYHDSKKWLPTIFFPKPDTMIVFLLPQAKHKIAEVEHALAVSEAFSKAAAEAEVGKPCHLFG
jgi:hypothetical protein